MKNKELGDLGEKLAVEYIEDKGYKIVEKNFRCKFGEIDIIAKNDNFYIFIEVKTRKSLNFGRPIESITKNKINHITKTIFYYLNKNNIKNYNIRIDAVEIIIKDLKNYIINHIPNIYLY
ncbi:YraN family protein [Caminicella sporogenes]|uniref:YraN family protein n=1 Tax=Caminicella sporogenes TaxID=166485 RepID=UPI0025411EBD|nr:YraN family protein [Caminicella sporogenes]WIF94625.1 YraN family protein [Caminicella sporogenes]